MQQEAGVQCSGRVLVECCIVRDVGSQGQACSSEDGHGGARRGSWDECAGDVLCGVARSGPYREASRIIWRLLLSMPRSWL
eukprot:5307645-Pyramimonas_sp.AAC.1